MRATTSIDAGICGFHTQVQATSEDGMFVTFDVASDCEKISRLGEIFRSRGAVNAYEEINPNSESVVMATASECLKGCCAGCVVPIGLFKSMQVACGLALAKDIAIHIVKEEC